MGVRGKRTRIVRRRRLLVGAACLTVLLLPVSGVAAAEEPTTGAGDSASEAETQNEFTPDDSTPEDSAGGVEVVRYAGSDQYALSLAVAQALVDAGGGTSEWVVLASGESWADAATAGPLAASLDAPVVLVPPGGLQTAGARPDLVEFLRSSGVRRVVIIGSPDALPNHEPSVLFGLGMLPRNIERIHSDDPIGTSIAIAERIGAPAELGRLGRTVFISSDQSVAGAVAVGPLAATGPFPSLLTSPGELDARITAYLAKHEVEHVVLVGGTTAIAPAVHESIETAGATVTRLAGRDRSDTARLAADLFKQHTDEDPDCADDSVRISLVPAQHPERALTANPLLAQQCTPLRYIEPGKLPDDLQYGLYLAQHSPEGGRVVVFADDQLISDSLVRPSVPPVRVETWNVISGHADFWCALTSEGHIECWDLSSWGMIENELADPPSGTFTAIDVGAGYACAIRTDRSLVCWGAKRRGGREIPVPEGDFLSVTVGSHDACAIRTDATVACWNQFRVLQQVPGDTGNARVPTGKFISVAASGTGMCGVRINGDLDCWGLINHNKTPANGKFASVAGSCALRVDRSLACWDHWRIVSSTGVAGWRPIPYGAFLSASATGSQGCAVALDGALACWGYGSAQRRGVLSDQYTAVAATTRGFCGLTVRGSISCYVTREQLPTGARFGPSREQLTLPGHDVPDAEADVGARARRIGMGDDFMCMLQADSTIRCFGTFEQWYHETNEIIGAVAPPGQFASVVAGPNFACALTLKRTVVCWGPSSQDRDPRWGDPVGPGAVPSGKFAALAAGRSHTCGLRDDRGVECWFNGTGQLLDTPEGTYVDIAAGRAYTCALRDDGVIVCWNTSSWNTTSEQEIWQHSLSSGGYTRLASGTDRYCAIGDDNQFSCWRGNDYRFRDSGSGEPLGETVFATFTDLAIGKDHSCGLKPDNTVACWDRGGSEHMEPPEGEFFEIYSGSGTSCAVDAQSEVTCWGRNYGGQASITTQQFTSISSGGSYSCGVRTDKTLACWGSDGDHPLTLPSGEFVQIDIHSYGHRCALRTDGSVSCWGGGDLRHRGVNTLAGEFTSVSAGEIHVCGIDTDRAISCSGSFDHGLRKPPEGRFTALASSDHHSCALSVEQEVICWGSDRYGQTSPPPGQFTEIAAGPFHSCGIRVGGEVDCWGSKYDDEDALSPEGRFVKVDASYELTCGIRLDATIACSGERSYHSDSPSGEFVDLSVGPWHACALSKDGGVTCWGDLANVLWQPFEIGELRLTRTSAP